MFPKEHIDGNSSDMPEATNKVANQVVSDDDDGEEQASPVIRNSKRRVACIASSPTKKRKDSVQRDFKRIVDHSISTSNSVESTANSDSVESTANSNLVTSTKFVTLTSEIKAIMDKVVECGAPEGSAEYYIATKLFGKFINRCFFYTMKTSEGRLNWLKRHYEHRRRH